MSENLVQGKAAWGSSSASVSVILTDRPTTPGNRLLVAVRSTSAIVAVADVVPGNSSHNAFRQIGVPIPSGNGSFQSEFVCDSLMAAGAGHSVTASGAIIEVTARETNVPAQVSVDAATEIKNKLDQHQQILNAVLGYHQTGG